jgi:hypothetical protein
MHSRAIITLLPITVVLDIMLNAPIPDLFPRHVSDAKKVPFSILTFSPHDFMISRPHKARKRFAPKFTGDVDSGNLDANTNKNRPSARSILFLFI